MHLQNMLIEKIFGTFFLGLVGISRRNIKMGWVIIYLLMLCFVVNMKFETKYMERRHI